MNRPRSFRRAALAALALLGQPGASPAADPVSVIFDTDVGPDCDDVSALCVLHGLAQRGEAEILATICCTSSDWGAPCLDAINTYFGRPEIAVGTLKDPGLIPWSPYNRAVAERYPHRLKVGKDAPDATDLYRKILAGRADGGVVIVAVGPLRNLRKLLESGADEHSSSSGKDLVARKVRLLSCMGGRYPRVPEGGEPEWNFAQDEESARNVLREWPTPIVFSGAEVGSGIMTGRRVALDGPEHHPLNLAFAATPDVGFGADRASWDDTSVLVAVRGAGPAFDLSKPGTATPGPKGANAFVEAEGGAHRYLIRARPVAEVEDVLEGLMVAAEPRPPAFDFNVASFARDGIGTISAGDEAPPSGRKEHAFDRDPKTVWATKSPGGWVQYRRPDGRKSVVARYRIVAGPDSPESDPRAWTLAASDDGGASWVELDARSGEVFAERGQTREFTCRGAAPHDLFRLRFGGESAVRVGEVELLEPVGQSPAVGVSAVSLDRPTLSLAADARASLDVAVTPDRATGRAVTWATSDPAVATVKRIGGRTAVVSARKPGSCVVTATARDGGKAAECRVDVTPSTLPAPWAYEEVNEPHVPGAATYRDGEFRVVGGGIGIERWWQRNWDQFSLVSREQRGDGAISARVVAQTAPSPHAIAGLMFRETSARDSRFVLLGHCPTGEVFLAWRDGPDDEGPRTILGKFALPVSLKLERRGDTFEAYVSGDGKGWGKPAGSHPGRGFAPVLKAGLAVCARNDATTSEVAFDRVIPASPPSR